MRFVLSLALLSLLAAPAMAQEDGTPVSADDVVAAPASSDADGDQRLALATRMHEIWPVSTRVEEAIDLMAENVPDGERDSFKTKMRRAIDKSELERESVTAMAAVYTEAELQAMVQFYGSAEGRSISAKTDDYMKLLEPIMVKMLDSALLKLRTGAPLQSTPSPTP